VREIPQRYHWIIRRELTSDGVIAIAQVTDKAFFTPTRTDKDGKSREGITTYTLRYRFTHPETGSEFEDTADV